MVFTRTFPLVLATALVTHCVAAVGDKYRFWVTGDRQSYGVYSINYNNSYFGGAGYLPNGLSEGGPTYYEHDDVSQVLGVKGKEYGPCVDSTSGQNYTFIGQVSFQLVTVSNQTPLWVGPFGNEPELYTGCYNAPVTDFNYTDITHFSFVSNLLLPDGQGSLGPFNGTVQTAAPGGAGNTKKPKKKHSSTTTILLATLLPLLCLSCIAIVVLSACLLMRRRRDAGGNGTAHEAEGDDSSGHQPLNYGGADGGDDQEEHRAELERMEAAHAERVRLLKAQAEVSS